MKNVYNIRMTPQEEKRLLFGRKARYFLSVMAIYVAVYFVLYLILSFIHAIVYLNPYFRMAVLLLFFVAASVITNRIMATPFMRSFIEF